MQKKYFRQEAVDVLVDDVVKIGDAEFHVETISVGGYGLTLNFKDGSKRAFSAADDAEVLARGTDTKDYCRASF